MRVKMEITVEELGSLKQEQYHLVDIRSREEFEYGCIPGASFSSIEELFSNPPEEKDKKIIIYCSRGIISIDVAEKLTTMGYDAYSLEGGYYAWLLDDMTRKQNEEVCQEAEKSLRKKYRKTIWCKFVKAVKQYELVQEGDKIAVCISGGKDSMLMAKLFQELKRHNKFHFELKFLVMDPGYNEENRQIIEQNAKKLNIPLEYCRRFQY